MSLGIDLNQYATNSNTGFGMNGIEGMTGLSDLQKALATSQTGRDFTNNVNPNNSYGALKVESLDHTLKILQFSESDIRLWKAIPKSQATNTVEEYLQLTNYSITNTGFIAEGGLPANQDDSQYVRRAELVKFIATQRFVTHPASLVSTVLSNTIMQQEIHNGTMAVLQMVDQAILRADSRVIPLEFNGIMAQHEIGSGIGNLETYYQNNPLVINMNGGILTENVLTQGADTLIQNWCTPNHFFAPTTVLSNFTTNFFGNKFIQPNTPALTGATMGQRVNEYMSQFGPIALDYDIFMRGLPPVQVSFNPGGTFSSTNLQQQVNAPLPPTLSANATPVTTDNSVGWNPPAGFVWYAVAAVNANGTSTLNAGSIISIATTGATTNSALQFNITPSGGPNPTQGYIVYRITDAAAATATATPTQLTFFPLFRISSNQVGLSGFNPSPVPNGTSVNFGPGVIRDSNWKIPNTSESFLFDNNNQVWDFKQLAPLMKMDLAVISTSQRVALLLYGTPILYAPSKMLRIINVV